MSLRVPTGIAAGPRPNESVACELPLAVVMAGFGPAIDAVLIGSRGFATPDRPRKMAGSSAAMTGGFLPAAKRRSSAHASKLLHDRNCFGRSEAVAIAPALLGLAMTQVPCRACSKLHSHVSRTGSQPDGVIR